MQTPQNETNVYEQTKPFSVDIFSENYRFSRPASIVFLHHLYRWSIYVFIPFFICLIPAVAAVYVIVNPIKIPLDTTKIINVIAVSFFGIVIPGILLMTWYHSIPWWFLNGTERCWQTFKQIAEANEHRFPDDFWHPFIHSQFGLEEDAFADELVINADTDIEGFIGADINISYKDKVLFLNTPTDKFGFYVDSTYWRVEKGGLRFYGERMNIFVPYRAMQSVRRGLIWCNIVLKLDTSITGRWTEICISIGHLPTMRGDRMLRDELFQRITALKVVDLMKQLTDNSVLLTVEDAK